MSDLWTAGEKYEPYVGRWSRLVAPKFLASLEVAPHARWLDVGCGTGALTQTILASAEPASVVGVDPSAAFLEHARSAVSDARAEFRVADAMAIGGPDDDFDAVVSGLMLNFVPDAVTGVTEMRRVARPGAIVAAYVWDYAEGMQLMRHFWDAAVELDPAAHERDEAVRSPVCAPDRLAAVFTSAGLDDVHTGAVVVPTRFRDFDDYWSPFLSANAPAPLYARSLDEPGLARLRDLIASRLPYDADGSIPLTARAWTVRGVVPG